MKGARGSTQERNFILDLAASQSMSALALIGRRQRPWRELVKPLEKEWPFYRGPDETRGETLQRPFPFEPASFRQKFPIAEPQRLVGPPRPAPARNAQERCFQKEARSRRSLGSPKPSCGRKTRADYTDVAPGAIGARTSQIFCSGYHR